MESPSKHRRHKSISRVHLSPSDLMPRNLEQEQEQAALNSMEPLASEAQLGGPRHPIADFDDDDGPFMGIPPQYQVSESLRELHPYAQTLTLQDLDSVVKLEEETFPPHQRGTREKFLYRLNKCSELCLGIFTSAMPSSPNHDASTAVTANPPDSSAPERKGILLAHIIATKSVNPQIHDDDMKIPEDWQTDRTAKEGIGHQEHGRTIALHSLAVLPQYQKRGVGTMLMKAYVQRMAASEIADRISIICQDSLVPYYERLGFEKKGKSNVEFGGGDWVDMVLDFTDVHTGSEDEEDEY